jgi:hypothetical protein
MQIREAQQELQQLFFLGGCVVAGAIGQELDCELGLHVQLIQRGGLNWVAFAAKRSGRFQLVHGAFEIVFHAERFLSKRWRNGVRTSDHLARKLCDDSQNTLLGAILLYRIEQSTGQTLRWD